MNLVCFLCKLRVQWSPHLSAICFECRDTLTNDDWETVQDQMYEALHSEKFRAKYGTRQECNAAFDAKINKEGWR